MLRPIPDLSGPRSDRLLCRNYPIRPVSETCVAVNHAFRCHSYYWHYDPRPHGAMEQIFLRQTLVAKLARIDRILRECGLCLLIQEGYRPLSVQRFVREVSVVKKLKLEYPGLEDGALLEKAKMFAAWVNGDLQSSPPPHLTGGAVDLTLAYAENGAPVDMGKNGGLFDTAAPDTLEARYGFGEARRFRRMLFWAAAEEQMIVNPTEWWHLSWGDQMWACITKAKCALYSVAENVNQCGGS